MRARRRGSQEVLYGFHPVHEALRAGRRRVLRVYVAREGHARERHEALRAAGARAGIAVEEIAREALERVARSADHQGVAATADPYPYEDEGALLARLRALAEPALVLALDGIQDPRNLGSMVRNANVAGAHAVVIAQDRSAEVTPAAAKASAGAVEYTPVVRVVNLVRTLALLKEAGLWVAGAETQGEVPIDRLEAAGPIAIVIGGEEKGLRPLVRRTCDLRVAIPVRGAIQSLNAGVAAAVILFEVVRQRRQGSR
ncbi:MAG: 23S rRNA (guanosine(2251)-2'-O)-methyltransferase RlmB [Actinobacteria bacterium RBG_13_63_9]|nr:MAG: 23S rRNA (guanosine(2251)-2'-O)-methyltransferase RlmB [Actinobacteria bacterium RBG_13_63_9]